MSKPNKKTKVALVNPPLPEQTYQHPQFPPLGLAYLAAVLEKNDYEVRIMDCPVSKIDSEKLRRELTSFAPDLVGIASMTPTIPSALKSASVAKEACPESKVIMGGPHATFADKQILSKEPNVDIIVRGEGEETLLELAQKSTDTKSLQQIRGITFRNNREIVQTPNRPFIEDLDALPYPAYHFIPIDKYRVYGKKHLPLMSSRGCPFQCSFCVATQMFGTKFRGRSPKNVVDELEWLKTEHRAEGVSFHDDSLTLDRERIIEICDEIINRKLGIPWGCQTRVDLVSRKILAKMKKANCDEVSFGVESGCQRILDAVGKKVSVRQCERAVKWAKEEGLFVAVSSIIGYPGETKESMIQTLDLMRRIKPDDAWLCIATPYPGTKLRALIEKMGWKMTNDWTLYNAMNPVFENPLVSAEEMHEMRRIFYNNLYTPGYVIRQFIKGSLKGNFYSKIMARAAANYLLGRITSRF